MTDPNRPGVPTPDTLDGLLTILPYHLGHTPENIITVALFNDNGQMPAIMSIDLHQPTALSAATFRATSTTPAKDPDTDRWARIAHVLTAEHIQDAAVILYGPAHHAPRALDIAQASPVPVRHTIRVHHHQFWDLTTAPARHRTWQPSPTLEATCIAAGLTIADSLDDLHRRLTPGTHPQTPTVETLLATSSTDQNEDTHRPGTLLAAYQHLDAARRTRQDGPRPFTPDDAARAITALSRPTIRTACLTWADDASTWLWDDLLATAPPAHAADILGMTATTHYFRHHTLLALLAAHHALRLDPQQPEALLIAGLIQHHSAPHDNTTYATAETTRALRQITATDHPANPHHS